MTVNWDVIHRLIGHTGSLEELKACKLIPVDTDKLSADVMIKYKQVKEK